MTPDYSRNDPKGWCGDPRRGAALGRHDRHCSPNAGVKLYLRRVYLDSQGYDKNGTYFGWGKPLYWYCTADGSVDAMTRADDRDDAKAIVRGRYPNARFFR